jgi:hypothetical protein
MWFEGFLLVVAVPGWLLWKWARTHRLGPCLWCGGSGKNPFSTRNRWDPCRRCGGSRQRTRRV